VVPGSSLFRRCHHGEKEKMLAKNDGLVNKILVRFDVISIFWPIFASKKSK